MTSQTHSSRDESKPKILKRMGSARALKTLLLASLFSKLKFLSANSLSSSVYSDADSQEQVPDSANRCNLLSIFDITKSFQSNTKNNIFKYVFCLISKIKSIRHYRATRKVRGFAQNSHFTHIFLFLIANLLSDKLRFR